MLGTGRALEVITKSGETIAVAIVIVLMLVQPVMTAQMVGWPVLGSQARFALADTQVSEPVPTEATLVASWVTSPMSGPVPKAVVPNFGVIEDGILYRSSQPSSEGYKWLRDYGIKSIVSFQAETGDNTSFVLQQGFAHYLWLNIEDHTQPTDEQAKRFLDFVTNPDNWPVLIHCRAGMGRTGTLAALVRYSVDGWRMQDALEEVRLYSGGKELVGSQAKWLKQWALNHPRGSFRPPPLLGSAQPPPYAGD
jgi:tyrosine-protein phosphatase SIW14